MLFLVLSTPKPERPSAVAADRRRFWAWLAPHQKAGTCRWIHARVGRGAAALFEVSSNEQLHVLLTGWSEHVPAEFDVHPLIDAKAAQKHLAVPRKKARRARKKAT
ncbi:MAG TPA: DUF3303 family protein [Burkholderiales bacterium]